MAADVAAAKAAARKTAFAARKAVHSAERSARLCAELLKVLEPAAGLPVSGYLPIRTEVDIRPAMAALSRDATVGVPVVLGPGRPLVFHQWTPDCDLQEGPFGAPVPVFGREMTPRIVLVPMLAFDEAGNRLGYGGGFYDRTLERLRAAGPVTAIGIAYAGQRQPALPVEPTDRRLDAVVTEEGLVRFVPEAPLP